MTTDEKLDLIISELSGINKRLDVVDKRLNTIESDIVEMKDRLVSVAKRLFIIDNDVSNLIFKVDEIRSWTRLDLKDNPFARNRAVA